MTDRHTLLVFGGMVAALARFKPQVMRYLTADGRRLVDAIREANVADVRHAIDVLIRKADQTWVRMDGIAEPDAPRPMPPGVLDGTAYVIAIDVTMLGWGDRLPEGDATPPEAAKRQRRPSKPRKPGEGA